MPRIRPNFMDSSYFVDEPGNWHLKAGAPKEMQTEFHYYLQSLEDNTATGSINGNNIDYPFQR